MRKLHPKAVDNLSKLPRDSRYRNVLSHLADWRECWVSEDQPRKVWTDREFAELMSVQARRLDLKEALSRIPDFFEDEEVYVFPTATDPGCRTTWTALLNDARVEMDNLVELDQDEDETEASEDPQLILTADADLRKSALERLQIRRQDEKRQP